MLAMPRLGRLPHGGTGVTALALHNLQTPRDIKAVLAATCPTLKKLSIGGKKMTNDIFKTMAKHLNFDLLETYHQESDVKADGGAILGLLRQCSSMKDLHVNSGWSNPLSPDLIVNALSEARAGGAPLLERLTLEPSFAQAVQMRGLVACAKRLPELQHLHLKALSLTGIEHLALGSDPFPKMQRLKCLEILAFGGAYGGGLATVRLRGCFCVCVCVCASACAFACAFAGAATGVGMVGSYYRLAMRISSPARGCTAHCMCCRRPRPSAWTPSCRPSWHPRQTSRPLFLSAGTQPSALNAHARAMHAAPCTPARR